MSIKSYAAKSDANNTAQTEPIPGSNQQKNNAGGYSFVLDNWGRLDRFLILGSDSNTYYQTAKALTAESANAVLKCIEEDGVRTVERITAISDQGRAPKNEPAIYALALCLRKGNPATVAAAKKAVNKVCRIGTHVFQLAESLDSSGGWGSVARKAISGWYQAQDPNRLAMNIIKYGSREGWSHKDLLAKAHPVPANEGHAALFRWLKHGNLDGFTQKRAEGVMLKYDALNKTNLPEIIEGYEQIRAEDVNEDKAANLITSYGLPREVVPTQLLNSPKVWQALLTSGKGMPYTALIRNLAKMTSVGLLKDINSNVKYVVERLTDADGLRSARVHPYNVLIALRTYQQGHGEKGSLSWSPVSKIVDALDDAFYASFKHVDPSGKNILVALDVSGSMGWTKINNSPITPAEASAAMAMVTMRTEKWHHVVGFMSGSGKNAIRELNIGPKMRLNDVMQKISGLQFGGTDCSLPMQYAQANKMEVDSIQVYTDSETYAGTPHPSQALKNYRKAMGRKCGLAVVGMVSNGFTIADPTDPYMMDFVGFDANAPALLADFARGEA